MKEELFVDYRLVINPYSRVVPQWLLKELLTGFHDILKVDFWPYFY